MARPGRILIAVVAMSMAFPALAAAAPTPSVTLTQYSPTVVGTINPGVSSGEGGVVVSLTLKRQVASSGLVTVATGSASTGADGSWSATLVPAPGLGSPTSAFGVPGDQLAITYGAGSSVGVTPPGPSTYVYANPGTGNAHTVSFGSGSAVGLPTVSGDGKSIATPDNGSSCQHVSVVIDGVAAPPPAYGSGTCNVSPTPPVRDADHVDVLYTSSFTDPSSAQTSTVTVALAAGLPGVGSGPAEGAGPSVCTADLVSGQVTCGNLDSGTFEVALNGNAPQQLSPGSASGSWVNEYGSVFLPGLTAGDTVTLSEGAGPISVLHVSSLRVSEGLNGALAGGACQPGKVLGGDPTNLYTSPTGLCAADGSMSGDPSTFEYDDLSGGLTLVNVPVLDDLVPADGSTLASNTFTATADIANVGTVAQQASQVRSVVLQITPAGSSTPVYSQPGSVSPAPGDSNPPASASVSHAVAGLAAGSYDAVWNLTDSNGDTASYGDDAFTVPPGSAGSPGTAGPTGTTGSTGTSPNPPSTGATGVVAPAGGKRPTASGVSSQLTCGLRRVTTGRGASHRARMVQSCTVSVHAPGKQVVTVQITQGKRTYAHGRAALRGGIARLRLTLPSNARRGRYQVTIALSAPRVRTVVIHYTRHLT